MNPSGPNPPDVNDGERSVSIAIVTPMTAIDPIALIKGSSSRLNSFMEYIITIINAKLPTKSTEARSKYGWEVSVSPIITLMAILRTSDISASIVFFFRIFAYSYVSIMFYFLV